MKELKQISGEYDLQKVYEENTKNFLVQFTFAEEADLRNRGDKKAWDYVKEKIKTYILEHKLSDVSFWEIFHAAWGLDRGDGERRPDYLKEFWMYVHVKLEMHFS